MHIERSTIEFADKKISRNAVFAVILGIVLLAAHLVLTIFSVIYQGGLPLAGGVAESYLLLFGVFGIFWAVLSCDDEQTVSKYKALGIVLNGIALFLSLVVMAVGFMAYDI